MKIPETTRERRAILARARANRKNRSGATDQSAIEDAERELLAARIEALNAEAARLERELAQVGSER